MILTSPKPSNTVVDSYGRTLRYLRISVTDRCNLRCQYCNPNTSCAQLAPELFSWEDLYWMVQVASEHLGVEALRITGGEPTIRAGLVNWVSQIRQQLPSIINMALTTNGVLLESQAKELSSAGISRVNISIDSLQPERFKAITRGGELQRVTRGFHKAQECFQQVKINVVALKNQNIQELPDFVSFSDEHKVEVRFIEPMPLGNEKDYWREVFVSSEELRLTLKSQGYTLTPLNERSGYGPATYFQVEGTNARLGFISQMSCTKCASCNKLRITSDGTLRPCLLSHEEFSLATIVSQRNSDEFIRVLRSAFLNRAPEYSLEAAVTKSLGRSMQCIGG